MATNFPNGLTTAASDDALGSFVLPDLSKAFVFFDDFDSFDATDANWIRTIISNGSGSASAVVTDGDGGILLLTNDNADNDKYFVYRANEHFTFETGKQLWFKVRLKVSDATQSDWVAGFQSNVSDPLAPSNGVYFEKLDGSTDINLHKESSNTITSVSGIASNVSDTYLELGFYFDGFDTIKSFKDGALISITDSTNVPTTELRPIWGIQNGEAAIKTMSIDYIFAAKER